MNSSLSDPAFWDRFQFGFTLVYDYLFPQLTMGLAWFLVYWRWRALKTGDEALVCPLRFKLSKHLPPGTSQEQKIAAR